MPSAAIQADSVDTARRMRENRPPPTFRAGLRVRVVLTVREQRGQVLQGAWRLQAIDVAQADEKGWLILT
jgi:hypothetical protein